jgi:hypothetical protein
MFLEAIRLIIYFIVWILPDTAYLAWPDTVKPALDKEPTIKEFKLSSLRYASSFLAMISMLI